MLIGTTKQSHVIFIAIASPFEKACPELVEGEIKRDLKYIFSTQQTL